MSILEKIDIADWHADFTAEQQQQAATALEQGHVVFFPQLAFTLGDNEQRFLSPDCTAKGVKNVKYDIHKQLLGGTAHSGDSFNALQHMIHRYATQTDQLVARLLTAYRPHIEQARTSYRPVQVYGRACSYLKNDSLLHVDAFPATPNHGKRILRVFSNVNPHGEDRVWRVGEPFADLVTRFAPQLKKYSALNEKILHWIKATRSVRSPYDHYMLQLHNTMKGDGNYQKNVSQTVLRLPPNSTWMVYTDLVSHAALNGQYVFEQTFHVPVSAMLNPSIAPLTVMQNQMGF